MPTERERSPLAAAGMVPVRKLRRGHVALQLDFNIFQIRSKIRVRIRGRGVPLCKARPQRYIGAHRMKKYWHVLNRVYNHEIDYVFRVFRVFCGFLKG